MKHPAILTAAAALCLAATAFAARPGEDEPDLTSLSLEELMNIEVTVASKSKQKLSEIPAAVYVITGDEIRRAGHSSIPEALRMVPGFYVSRWAADAWDVTSRGFGPGLSLTSLAYLNQLLVIVDGVVVYSPLFAGTWWPLQDLDLADVDRIEVIRGPGGILWGSNAVHGVVHVITKRASETQGLQATVYGATDDRHGTLRFGEPFGEKGAYRVWVKRSEYDTPTKPFLGFDEDWHLTSGGMRADWSDHGHDYTFWMRGYAGRFDYPAFDLTFFIPYQDVSDKRGFQIFGSMYDPETDGTLQAWYSNDRQNIPTLIGLKIDTFDVEYHRGVELGESSKLLLGGGYRLIRSILEGDDPFFLTFDPEESTQNVFRAFAVHTLDLHEDVRLTTGLTLEHNDFTQFEVQPTARATWTPAADWMTWASISRAVRTPSLEERFLDEDSYFIGSSDFDSEVLWAYELGARKRFGELASADLALFYNDYDHLHFADPGGFGSLLTNDADGKAWGVELALDLQPTDWWRLRSAYSILHGDYEIDGTDLITDDYHPEEQLNLRSYVDLGANWELDSAVYSVDRMGSGFEIAEYTRVDVRLGWSPSDSLDLFVGVQDVGHDTRSEYSDVDNPRRSVYFGLSWHP